MPDARPALIIAGAIFPWCVAMGATFPFMMAFLRERDRAQQTGFSFLYLANVVGAGREDRITDDRPFNEYFVLRRNWPKLKRFFF